MMPADRQYTVDIMRIRTQAGPNARIAFVSGNFNVVHPGHLRLLKFAREQADFLVVGDVIIDEYINCDPLGMSQEDPTLVVTPIESMKFVGGAGIVAAHARGLGANVRFVSLVGDDMEADFVRKNLANCGVEAELFTDDSRPTTLKQRYRAHGKTLLRVNYLRQHAPPREISRRMLNAFESALSETDLVLFADFNYGCLPQMFVDMACSAAIKHSAMMAADSQASSQLSDISRFKDMALITPTEREARLALHDFDSGLAVVAENLRARTRAENLVITLGGEGLLVRAAEAGEDRMDRLPAFNSAPKDVAGAGDSFFTCTSLALAAGIDIWSSAYLGSIASACQTARVGNTPLTWGDIQDEIYATD